MSDIDQRLKSFLDRIMRLHEERKALSEDISDLYKEVKSVGFDRKAMVNTVKRLMGDSAAFAELDELTDLYLQAYRGVGTGNAFTHTSAPAQPFGEAA